jgi:hypothetical protein
MPDGSSSIMSGLSMSDIDSNYDTMSISSKINISGSKMEYGRQKKKWVIVQRVICGTKSILFSTGNTITVTTCSVKPWKLERLSRCGMDRRLSHGSNYGLECRLGMWRLAEQTWSLVLSWVHWVILKFKEK